MIYSNAWTVTLHEGAGQALKIEKCMKKSIACGAFFVWKNIIYDTLENALQQPAQKFRHQGMKKAGDGNRTHVSSLEGWCSTIELHPHTLSYSGGV